MHFFVNQILLNIIHTHSGISSNYISLTHIFSFWPWFIWNTIEYSISWQRHFIHVYTLAYTLYPAGWIKCASYICNTSKRAGHTSEPSCISQNPCQYYTKSLLLSIRMLRFLNGENFPQQKRFCKLRFLNGEVKMR